MNGALADADYAAPYTFTPALPKGRVTILVKAYDAAGNVGQTTVVLRLRAALAAHRR